MKNWILNNKNLTLLYFLFLLVHVVNRFGELTGQYAKLELACYVIFIYLPFFIQNVKNFRINEENIYATLLVAIPLSIELLINALHDNHNKIAYYDLSVMSISLIFLYYFLSLNIEKREKNLMVGCAILSIALIILIFAIGNIIINFNGVIDSGAYITGNQNISSYILLVSLPFLRTLPLKNLYKLSYVFLVVLVICFIFKARIPSVIVVVYCIYLVLNLFNIKNSNILAFGLFLFGLIFISLLFFYNQRFSALLNYDLYLRAIPLMRVWESFTLNNFIFGVGTGNIAVLIYSAQDLYPVLEIMNPGETYTYAHNFLVDRLVSGGILVFISYLIIYGLVVYRYIGIKDRNSQLQALFHSYSIGLLLSFYDVVHNSFSGYSIFILILGMLIINLFEFKIKLKKVFLLTCLIFFIPALIFKNLENKDHHYDYNSIINRISLEKSFHQDIVSFSARYPHYAEIDALDTYHRNFVGSYKSDPNGFQLAFKNMNTFNKYRNSRLHFSSQYYALLNLENDLVDVYSDILYRSLIVKKVVTPLYDRQKISVKNINDGSLNINFISQPCCTLNIPSDMFRQIKYVNSGLTNLKITEESIDFVAANATYSIDSKNSTRDTIVVKEFLRDVNKFSGPLKF